LLTGEADRQNYSHRPIYLVNGNVEAVRADGWKYREILSPLHQALQWLRQNKDPEVRAHLLQQFPQLKTLLDAPGKAVEIEPEIRELFNLNRDPSERVNVIDRYPEKAQELKALFDAFPGDKEND
jgi:arylsulfatase A-like enzyme